MLLAQYIQLYQLLYLFWIVGFIIVVVIILVCAYGIREAARQAKKSVESSPATRSFYPRKVRTKSRTISTTQTIQLTMCPKCEATILAETVVCPHCDAPRPVCMVCHHPIEFVDSVLLCPHCKGQAHRIHFLEFLKVKGTCPHCQSDLDEHELILKRRPDSTDE